GVSGPGPARRHRWWAFRAWRRRPAAPWSHRSTAGGPRLGPARPSPAIQQSGNRSAFLGPPQIFGKASGWRAAPQWGIACGVTMDEDLAGSLPSRHGIERCPIELVVIAIGDTHRATFLLELRLHLHQLIRQF